MEKKIIIIGGLGSKEKNRYPSIEVLEEKKKVG